MLQNAGIIIWWAGHHNEQLWPTAYRTHKQHQLPSSVVVPLQDSRHRGHPFVIRERGVPDGISTTSTQAQAQPAATTSVMVSQDSTLGASGRKQVGKSKNLCRRYAKSNPGIINDREAYEGAVSAALVLFCPATSWSFLASSPS